MVLIYITCKDAKEAQKISEHLLKKRLIACSNMFPIRSMYWWKGKIEKSSEIAILAKTSDGQFEKIKKEVKKIHSYEIPAIVKIQTESEENYQNWVERVIS